MKSRPSFNEWFMKLAQVVAERSPDPKMKVGAILVSMDNRKILGTGYNGPIAGFPNKRESLETGKSGFIHAESNCLLNKNIEANLLDCKMFITHQPCENCARLIANSKNIKEVYFQIPYPHDTMGLKLLKKAKIKVDWVK